MSHPIRVYLYRLIVDRPGVAFLTLFAELLAVPEWAPHVGYGSLMHHLQVLERFGWITTRKSGHFRRHYENGGPWNGDTTALATLQTPTAHTLARLVLERPGISQGDAHRRCNLALTRQAVGYQLERLAGLGLVEIRPAGCCALHYPTEKLLRLLPYAESELLRPTPALVAPAALQVEGPLAVPRVT